MGGIVGVLNFDNASVDRESFTRMTDVIAFRGADGIGHWVEGNVALGHLQLFTTPESLSEIQPLTDNSGNLCLTFHGRLDNHEEIKRALISQGSIIRVDTDPELVLHTYLCWGADCLKRFIGDFAFVIWDARQQQLFCARDMMGIKPFYYYRDHQRFIFASEPRAILEAPGVPREPNEGMIGEYLAWSIQSLDETIYQAIFRLPPAHFMVVRDGQIFLTRYWQLDPHHQIRYKTDAEYAEHFFDVFQEAVRCRLRCHTPVGAELSGGVDSSSVVSMVQAIYQKGLHQNKGFETFSMVFPGEDCDESDYIDAVVEKWGLTSNRVEPLKSDIHRYVEDVQRHWLPPRYPNGAMGDPILQLAKSKGFQVLLTGLGGDYLFYGSIYRGTDFLQQRKLKRFYREYQLYHQEFSWVRFLKFAKNRARPLLAPDWVKLFRKVMYRKGFVPEWIHPKFAKQNNLHQRIGQVEIKWKDFASYAQADVYSAVMGGEAVSAREIVERSTSIFSIEHRHPFFDQRMVEFALAIPERQLFREGWTKYIVRYGMKDYLPEAIIQRTNKVEFSSVTYHAIQELVTEQFSDNPRLADIDCVVTEAARNMYEEMNKLYEGKSTDYKQFTWYLWLILSTDLWYRFSGIQHRLN